MSALRAKFLIVVGLSFLLSSCDKKSELYNKINMIEFETLNPPVNAQNKITDIAKKCSVGHYKILKARWSVFNLPITPITTIAHIDVQMRDKADLVHTTIVRPDCSTGIFIWQIKNSDKLIIIIPFIDLPTQQSGLTGVFLAEKDKKWKVEFTPNDAAGI